MAHNNQMEINHKKNELNKKLLVNLDLIFITQGLQTKMGKIFIFVLACDVRILQCEFCDLMCSSFVCLIFCMRPFQVVTYLHVLIHAFVFMIGKSLIFLHKIDDDNLFIAIVLFVSHGI